MRRTALAVAGRDFRGYFASPTGYVFIVAFLVLSSWMFFRVFFLLGQASMRPFFSLMPWLFLLFVPAAAMRLWAEERRSGTDEVLLTLPVRESEAVLGKFAASLGFLVLTIALTFPVPAIVALLGNPDPGPIMGGYLGLVLMGAAYLSIALFASSLTDSQIVAFIVAASLSFALAVAGESFVVTAVPRPLAPVLRHIGLARRFASISRGVIDSRDVVYYLSVIAFFLYANVRVIANRKWR
ncbi:MAG: ABC transporter permease subunit [Candidatus Eisenbacteria bacterium]|nr:ABC transporter permease subunit [Candidatus Eisenbacteria bacterium]